jgi:hypothetical protein
MTNFLGIRCPRCGDEDRIDIESTIWLRVCEDGTDADASFNGDHEYTPRSLTHCAACGHTARLSEFDP